MSSIAEKKQERAVEAKEENEAIQNRRKPHNPEFLRRMIAKYVDIDDFDVVVQMAKIGIEAEKNGQMKMALDAYDKVAPYTHAKQKAIEIKMENSQPFNFIMQLDAKPKEKKVIDVKPTEARIEIG